MGFILRQYSQIREQGYQSVFRKLNRLAHIILESPLIILGLLFVMIIRCLRLFVYFRIGSIDISRIGGVYQGDWYLSEKRLGKYKKGYSDWFYFNKSITHVNSQWNKMWKNALPYLPGIKIWKYFVLINRWFPGSLDHEIPNDFVYPDRKHWKQHLKYPEDGIIDRFNDRLSIILNNIKSNIAFNDVEINNGQNILKTLGIPKGNQYICFHSRDSVYLDSLGSNTMDWSYHNYRDSNIQNYIFAAEEMVKRGFFAIRMGSEVKEKINTNNPYIIDYAKSEIRTDFNDIYLGSHCRFFLCSDCGISIIPEMFRIPTIYVNWTLLLNISTWVINGIFIFKKFYLRKEDRLLTFSEMLNIILDGDKNNQILESLDIELIENSPDEICAAVIEMDERLNGTWVTTDEDSQLQKRFWEIYGPKKLKSNQARIGASFLRQNKVLLI